MTKFFEQLSSDEKQKYIKEIKKTIDTDYYTKILNFFEKNILYITNIKTNPIKIKEKKSTLILDNSDNKWFFFCIDGKLALINKKNIIIHTNIFNYKKRDVSFNKLYKIKKVDYLIENVQNLGANVSLNITNYNGLIGKNKWNDDINEISEMTLSSSKDTLNGYTYNGEYFSLCNIGKNCDKKKDVLI